MLNIANVAGNCSACRYLACSKDWGRCAECVKMIAPILGDRLQEEKEQESANLRLEIDNLRQENEELKEKLKRWE